jgi:hypothetical protein
MWSFGVVLGLTSEQAQRFQSLYETARDGNNGAAVLLGHTWQQRTVHVDEDKPTTPWANELHHRIADVLEESDAPGRTVALRRGQSVECPTVVRLPCRDCGHTFISKCRGDRFPRTCGKCFSYSPSPPQHPRGGLTLYADGVYRKRRRGSTLGVETYGQDVLCLYPVCLKRFVSARGDEEYCPEHRGQREQARRLRSRGDPPKHLRFRFRLAPDKASLQYHHGPDAEEVRLEQGECLVARDEQELLVLATFLEQRTVTVERIS